MANLVKFVSATSAAFKKLQSKDPNSLYFIKETGELYKGEILYNEAVVKVEQLPETPAKGKIYIVNSTNEIKFWTGTEYKEVIPVINKTLTDEASESGLVSGDAIKTYISNKLKNLSTDGVPVKVNISKEAGNKLVEKADGIFASGIEIKDAKSDEIVIANPDGSVKCSGFKTGSSELNQTPDTKTLATELAVSSIKNSLEADIKGKISTEKVLTKVSEAPADDNILSEAAIIKLLSWEELTE